MSAINKDELISEITIATGIPTHLVRKVVSECFEAMKRNVRSGVSVKVVNFGSFNRTKQSSKMKFVPSKNFMIAVEGGSDD